MSIKVFRSDDKPFRDMKTICGPIDELLYIIKDLKKVNDDVIVIDTKGYGDDVIMLIELINKDDNE